MARDRPLLDSGVRRSTSLPPGDAMISASEIASWAFCPEAWRLEYGLRLKPGNARVRAAGERHHAGKTRTERIAGGLMALGRVLMALAALLAAYWVFRWS